MTKQEARQEVFEDLYALYGTQVDEGLKSAAKHWAKLTSKETKPHKITDHDAIARSVRPHVGRAIAHGKKAGHETVKAIHSFLRSSPTEHHGKVPHLKRAAHAIGLGHMAAHLPDPKK